MELLWFCDHSAAVDPLRAATADAEGRSTLRGVRRAAQIVTADPAGIMIMMQSLDLGG
jgi:hypothetical protein